MPRYAALSLALVAPIWVACGPSGPTRVPRFVDASPGSCDGFVDFASEMAAQNYAIASQTPVGDGIDEVELSLELVNLEDTAVHSASLAPDFSIADLGVLPGSVLAADFPALVLGTPVASTNTLLFRAPAANITDIVARLNAGTIPVSVAADEEPVPQPGVVIANWSSEEDAAYAYARDNFVPAVNADPGPPPYLPDQQFTVFFMLPGDDIPSVLDTLAGNRSYLVPDPSYQIVQIPEVMHRVRVLDVAKSAEDDPSDPQSQDGVTYWVVTLQRTESEALPEIYASASFCTGIDDFVDHPVESTRLFELDGAPQEDEMRDANVLPLRFNVAPIPTAAIQVSGQIQGYALRPSLELRVRLSGLRVAANVDTDLSFTAEARAMSTVDVSIEPLSLWSLCFPLADLNAGPIPIGLNLQIEHLLDVEGGFTAGAVVGFQKSFDAGFTAGYDSRLLPGDPYFSESRHTPQPVSFTPPHLTEETGVHAEISTDVVTTLRVGARYPLCDTGAGAFLDARAFGTVDVMPAQDPWWTLGHGVELGAGIDFQILGFTVGSHRYDPVSLIGSETRSSTPPPLGLGPRGAAPNAPRSEGEDQRWAVAIDDTSVAGGTSETSIAAFRDGSSLVLEREGNGRNWLVRLDRFGAWQQTLHYDLGYIPKRVLALPDDSFLVAGTPLTWTDHNAADPGIASTTNEYVVGDASDVYARCELKDIAAVPEANGAYGFVVVGRIGRSLVSERDACALRVDPNGAIRWAKLYVDAGVQDLLGVAVLANGDFAAVGSTYPGPNASSNGNPLIMRIDPDDGSLLWAKSLPTYRGGDKLYAVAEAPDGTLVAVGGGLRIVSQSGNALLVRIDGDGSDARHGLLIQDETWEGLLDFEAFVDTQGGDTAYDTFYDIASAPGGFVVTGKTSAGTTEAPWVAKLNTELSVEWFASFDGHESDVLDAVVATPDGFLASGWSNSLEGVGQGATERWPWVLKVPFEGMLRLVPEASITSRYLEPGIRWTSGDPDIVPNGVVSLDAPLQVVDATLATVTPASDPLTTPQQICVHRLTTTGHISTLDGCADDLDGDGVLDDVDVCVGTANPEQTDTDGDGHGNACDADLDQNGIIDAADFTIWRDGFGLSAADPGFDAIGDFDGNGSIDLGDFALLRAMQGGAPGDPVALPMPDPSEMPLVEVIFPATGTNQISVAPGEPFTVQIRITADAAGISAYAVSLAFEAGVVIESTTELLPAGFDFSITPGVGGVIQSAGGLDGYVYTCEAASLGAGVANVAITACNNGVKVDGVVGPETLAIRAGFFQAGIDGMLSNSGADLSGQVVFIPGTIEVVPEADAAAASSVVAFTLAMLARSRRRLSDCS